MREIYRGSGISGALRDFDAQIMQPRDGKRQRSPLPHVVTLVLHHQKEYTSSRR